MDPLRSAQKCNERDRSANGPPSNVAAQVAWPWGLRQGCGLVSIETVESPFEDDGMATSPGTDRQAWLDTAG